MRFAERRAPRRAQARGPENSSSSGGLGVSVVTPSERAREGRPGRRRDRAARRRRRANGTLADYVALTKPRLNFLVVATSAAGYYLGAPAAPDAASMTFAVAGTALVAGGAAALNQVYERDTDA